MTFRFARVPAALVAAGALLLVAPVALAARTVAPQPAPDISKMDYTPIGLYKPGEPIPSTSAPPPPDANGLFNPSGKWVAYDTNVFETLNYPSRQAGDESNADPLGNGGQPHGFCPPNPQYPVWGKCANHQLEWLDYYERTMKVILGEFGVVVKRYEFESPGNEPRGVALATAPGRSFNISATVPGADNPEESVLVSGHFDFTDSGPAAAWDSAEGHTEVIRIAKIMADYWRATGTRPSATIKFIPWDQEESGTLGSKDYIEKNIPPGEEDEIRGYFNMDPCAGAFPAYYHGSGDESSRVPMVLQLAPPDALESETDKSEVTAFNDRAQTIVDDVFEHLDDTLDTAAGKKDIFVSANEAQAEGKTSDRAFVVTALGGLAAFTSDYANFQGIGVPIFNLFPDLFGPHADNTPASGEGVTILHTPRDNLTTINALTSPDQSGATASEGWAKGMELCAQLEGWYMLQPQMGGAQTASPDPVAYFEALPNEAQEDQQVTFDAGGSYQYSSIVTRSYTAEDQLEFRWDFGDGATATGKVARHAYPRLGEYAAKLTLRNRRTGQSDTMTIPITVVPSRLVSPVLEALPADDEDGTFPLKWSYAGPTEGLKGFSIEESEDYKVILADDAEGALEDKWEASPGAGARQPWQKSDSSTPKVRGNQRTSGEASYWTGGAPPSAPVGTNAEQTLTLKEPLELTGANPTLLYQSLFQMELDDKGRVELAIEDDNPATPLEWDVVDSVTGSFEPDNPSHVSTPFTKRVIDLSSHQGRKVRLRFVWALGASEGNRVQPAGWYVDDIHLSSGEFNELGKATEAQKEFTVASAPTGIDSYRVRALLADGIRSGPSNVGSIRIARGGPSRRARLRGGGAAACAAAAGFDTTDARPAGRGVQIGFARREGASAATVEIRQVARGRRVLRRPRIVARFTRRELPFRWNGRARGGRRLPAGWYVVRYSATAAGSTDVRQVALELRGGRFRTRAAFEAPRGCGLIASLEAAAPVLAGRRSLTVGYRLGAPGRATVTLMRGRRAVRRWRPAERAAGRTYRVRVSPRRLRRGAYRLRLRVTRGGETATQTITVRRL